MDGNVESLKQAAMFSGVSAVIAGCAGAGVAAVGVLGGVKVGLITGFIFQSSEKSGDKDENHVQTLSKMALGVLAGLGVTLTLATSSVPAALTFIGYNAAIVTTLLIFDQIGQYRKKATA